MKKKTIGTISKFATVLGAFLSYLEASGREEKIASIEKRLHDAEIMKKLVEMFETTGTSL